MNAVRVLPFLSKIFSTKVSSNVFSVILIRRNCYKTKPTTSLSPKSYVKNDVTLFHFENPRFFLFMNIVSVLQCAFWTYLGVFLFRKLENSSFNINSQKISGKILEMESKHSTFLSVFSIIFGWSMLVGTLLYSVRSIRKIILHKGGNFVTIITYNLPGYDTLKVPLSNISAFEHRTKAKKFIPMKIKNKYFYYLIDNNGKFLDPVLFDFTAGIKRNF